MVQITNATTNATHSQRRDVTYTNHCYKFQNGHQVLSELKYIYDIPLRENERRELIFLFRFLIQRLFQAPDFKKYESFSDVGESRVWWRADFQSGSRVLKKVF